MEYSVNTPVIALLQPHDRHNNPYEILFSGGPMDPAELRQTCNSLVARFLSAAKGIALLLVHALMDPVRSDVAKQMAGNACFVACHRPMV
jgi:hypothetical protein